MGYDARANDIPHNTLVAYNYVHEVRPLQRRGLGAEGVRFGAAHCGRGRSRWLAGYGARSSAVLP